jgi:hypothetical protein
MRNFPLHDDKTEETGISMADMEQYAAIMGESLAAMQWIGEVNGRNVEFVLAPAEGKMFKEIDIIKNALSEHCMWVLDFDRCQDMSMDINEVHYAFHAFWWSEPFMPRPGRNSPLWKAFRDQYPKTGQDSRIFCTGKYGISRLELAHTFIDLVEAEGDKRAEQARWKEEGGIWVPSATLADLTNSC